VNRIYTWGWWERGRERREGEEGEREEEKEGNKSHSQPTSLKIK